ncbi:MAG: recombinase family protein [Synergistaceae bacterium]|nr:recombinase family protein [Synergistaceae bacterium]
MQNKKIGYARVSMGSQDLTLQLDALRTAGVDEENIFIEKISGRLSKSQRPQLLTCFRKLREGDTLIVWKLDRLGRSLKDLLNLIQELEERRVHFRSLTETIDTSSPTGRLIFHIIAAFGEFERNLTKERSLAGLASARARGIVGGRRHKLSNDDQKLLVHLYKKNIPIQIIRERFGISKSCLYDYLRLNNTILRKHLLTLPTGKI